MKKERKYILVPKGLEYNDEYYTPSFIIENNLPEMINMFDSLEDAKKAREILTYNTIKYYSIDEIFNNLDHSLISIFDYLIDNGFHESDSISKVEFGSKHWENIYLKIEDVFSFLEMQEIYEGFSFELYGDYENFCKMKLKNGKFILHNENDIAIGSYGYGEYYLEGTYIGSLDDISEDDFQKIVKNFKLKTSIKQLLSI